MDEKFIANFLKDRESMELRRIEAIENSNLSIIDKKELLLVYLGEKPSLWFPIRCSFHENDEEEKEDANRRALEMRRNIESVLEELDNIFYEINDFETKKEDGKIEKGFDCIVGHSQENLSNLKSSFEIPSSEKRGIALGYPESSVKAYLSDDDEVFDVEEDTPELSALEKEEIEKTLKFGGFGLSRKNWREEIKIIERYRDVIKKKSPKIYNGIIED